jgi:hypothetical protein
MRDIFETSTEERGEFDGVDLLFGFNGDASGKSLEFFQKLARNKGVSAQQNFARFASGGLMWPHIVDNYAEGLVLRLHKMLPDRGGDAWELAKLEVEGCVDYLDVLSENAIVPLPFVSQDEYSEFITWEMRTLGDKHHRVAGELLPIMELYKNFCDDPTVFGDTLIPRLELHDTVHNKTS